VLPGKVYTIDDFGAALLRRKWIIIIPFVVVAFGTAVAAHFLPNRYRSEALILVVPQRVPESYVRSTVTTKIEDRLQAVRQQILSRTRLEQIIRDNNLYPDERREGIMEDVVDHMRRDVTIEVIRGDAFKLSYIGSNPRTVLKVTERLASMTIDENVNERAELAEGTNQFLDTQLANARRQLEDQEQKLKIYNQKYAGELPTQAQSNLQAAQNLQMQIQSVNDSLARDRDRRMIVQSQLNDLTAAEAQAPTVIGDPQNARPMSAQEQLVAAQAQLRQLEARLTPEHPDLIRARRMVADLQQRADAEALSAPVTPEANQVLTPAQAARRSRIRELQLELESLDRQLATKQTQEQQLHTAAAAYQARVEVVPVRESELANLTRDYTTLQEIYKDLLAKSEESKVAANLERRQIGEQFKLLDPAQLPQKPISPNRVFIDLVGAMAGLAFGVALAGYLEYRDSSFRTADEVVTVLGLPVLARIPNMVTAFDRRKQTRRRITLSTAGVALSLMACALVWKLGILNDLLR
jgi:polysaccharide chain length determinant protein (PEP-CTERM system associated)